MGYKNPLEQKDDFLAAPNPFVGPPAPTGLNEPAPPEPTESPAQPSFPDPSKYMVSPAELQQAAAEKRKAGWLGMIAQSLTNRQSAGNFATGKMAPSVDMSGFTKNLQEQADEPLAQKQALMKQEMQKPEMDRLKNLMNPDSMETQTMRALGGTVIESLKGSGMFKNNPEALTRLDQAISSGNGYQIHTMIEGSPFLKELASQAMADKRNETMMNRMAATMGYKQNQDAERTFNKDTPLTLYQQRLEGVGRITDLLAGARAGKVVTNGQVKGLIEEEIARLEQGSNSLALGHVERQSMRAAATNMANAKEFLTGKPQEAITPGQLKQLNGLLGIMTKSYMDQIDDRGGTLLSGMTDTGQAVGKKKLETIHNTFGKKFNGWGVEPNAEAGGTGAHPQDKAAVDWANAHPTDPRAAKILEANKVH